jgi:sugar phosphate permease
MPAVVISRWFRRRRGLALGLMTLGGGSAGVMSIVFALLIDAVGWREALIIAGVTQLAIATPLAFSIRNSPADMGLPIDGIADTDESEVGSEPQLQPDTAGLTSREALRSSLFWRFAIALALGNFATTALIVHQVPFLTESAGMSGAAAAASVTVMTALSLIGRLGMGSMADFLPIRLVISLALLCVASSLALFSTVHSAWQLVYTLPLFGLGFGGLIPTRSSFQAEYFGLRAFGAIQGLVLTVTTVGGFLGPVLAGWLYDTTNSYRLAFILLAAGPAVAIPLMLSSRPPANRPASI